MKTVVGYTCWNAFCNKQATKKIQGHHWCIEHYAQFKEEQEEMAQTPKATRQYVAISHAFDNEKTNRPIYVIETIGLPGETSQQVIETAWEMISPGWLKYGKDYSRVELYTENRLRTLEVVSLSVAKRSYKKAWREYQESLQLEQATKDTEGYSGNELYQALR